MHIEPGLVSPDKIWLSYVTGAAAGAYALKLAADSIRARGALSLVGRTAAATALVFSFFEVLPHVPVGVSEVHLILGSTLFLILGAAPAALGLALGLLLQGLFFAPFDLPQYGMNVTTLLVPLFGLSMLAGRVIAPGTPYVELRYRQALALSTGREVLPVKPEIAEAAYRQMREGDAESARLHLASIRRQLDAEEPAYRD